MSSTDQERIDRLRQAIRSEVSNWVANRGVMAPFSAPGELVDRLMECLERLEVRAVTEPFTAERYDVELAQLYGEMRSHGVQPDEARVMLGILERRAELARGKHLQGAEAPRYPIQDGETTVIGPECFTDGQVLCYQGENYVRQQEGYAYVRVVQGPDAPESSARRFTLSDETQDCGTADGASPGASVRRPDAPNVT